ncbi:hypothetical protein S7335_1853 [Synechococcus sp. PCC 7335]|uniref:zinc metalloprotease HtpX n=1 Tax=Synechococcus sp. (strain ATCC 29403 / PCC 7335) TaxID=91464 RepID=UPI00017EE3A8|nr:zinc metalloprotease HtpX [Synechococcus sp. PCC 7335]EDX84156.1 hypothetical protein S7335_1853 [Synechococcus sp. PCC 7335]
MTAFMPASATDLEKVFQMGIAAYQKGDYEQATSLFVRLTKMGSRTYYTKANLGLVRVYIAQKQWTKAKALCQRIIQTTSMPAARKWSELALININRQIDRQLAIQMATSDDASKPECSSCELKSGFQPIASDSQAVNSNSSAVEGAVGPTSSTKMPPSPLDETIEPTVSSATVVEAPNVEAPNAETPNRVSMFHYAYLNNEIMQEVDQTEVTGELNPTKDCLWIYAGRLDKGRSLGRIKQSQLWIAQLGSAIALYFLLRFLIHRAAALLNSCLSFLDERLPFGVWQLPDLFEEITWPLLIVLFAITIASPWLWDLYLRCYADSQPLLVSQLRTYSPEAARLISQYCRQRRWKLPRLWKLPTTIPLIFSYGWLPRNARLVVSDGLLSTLEKDELATLFAYELSHWKSGHWPLLTVHALLLQILHQTYWQLALWGNKRGLLLRWVAGTIANVSYALFWLVRVPGLWLARVRTYYGDRFATEITGNPNGLIRALTKLSFGLADAIEQQGYTPSWIESLSLLMPVCADLFRQHLYGHLPLADLFAWDTKNPLRNWMGFLNSQPPLGDRLCTLTAYAKHWKLTPEISFDNSYRKRHALSKQAWKRLFKQGTPYCGLVLGLVTGIVLWGIGAIAYALKWPVLDWMYQDTGLFQCCLLIGTGVGILLRINRFFPDLPSSRELSSIASGHSSAGCSLSSHPVSNWISHPKLLPIDSLPVRLTGTLRSRPGLANWLGQDLCIQTSCGLVKLHFFSSIGPLGNLLNRPKSFWMTKGESVQVTGWFRRGIQPWVDIHQIRLSNNRMLQAAHPIYSLLLATTTTGLGLWLLLQGH